MRRSLLSLLGAATVFGLATATTAAETPTAASTLNTQTSTTATSTRSTAAAAVRTTHFTLPVACQLEEAIGLGPISTAGSNAGHNADLDDLHDDGQQVRLLAL